MSYEVNGKLYRNEDYGAARDAATAQRARLIQVWQARTGEQRQDECAPYPAIDQTATHLLVESPIGVVRIPHSWQSRSGEPCPPIATVSLRVVGQHVQCSHVIYADGTSSRYSGVTFAREEVQP